jgi:hypothetical protein
MKQVKLTTINLVTNKSSNNVNAHKKMQQNVKTTS